MVLSFTALLFVGTDYPPGKFVWDSGKQILSKSK